MDKIAQKLTSAKNTVVKHRGKIVFVGTATACLALNARAMQQHNEFLKEKGLYDEFYTPEEEI